MYVRNKNESSEKKNFMILLAKATRAEAIERTSKRTLRRQQGGSKGQAIISYVKKEHRFNALEHMSWDPLGFFFSLLSV